MCYDKHFFSNNCVSPVEDETSLSYHHTSVDVDDYDTMSTADNETTLCQSDNKLCQKMHQQITIF